ncbi:NRDE family protein [Neobacillus sp. D3-1R]|uniref:NRDE family protein n=1 Tax=Neobacillus sp. D3-1R TaxID=3445778 RepID=UPI003FA1141A
MCLILFAYRVHPTYQLIVAANRDEFFERPTAPVHYWEDHPHILAGRDLKQMGTWMGITTSGHFAALTNYRDPKEKTEGKRSRGELVANFLKEMGDPHDYMKKVADTRQSYPGFNLIVGDQNALYYYSNIENNIQPLKPGIYGVSNHLLNTEWPKVKRGKEGLKSTIETGGDMVEPLFTLLQHADPAQDELLPQTGVSIEWERILSPIFIDSEGYGTRSSTVLLAAEKEFFYKERVYSATGKSDSEFLIDI